MRAWDLLVTSMGTMRLRRLQNTLWWSREIEISNFDTIWVKMISRIELMFTEVFWISSKLIWKKWKHVYLKTLSWWEKERISENGRKLVLMQDHLDLRTKAFCKSMQMIFILMSLKKGWCSGLATSEEFRVLRLVATEGLLWKWPTSFGHMLTPYFDRFWLPHFDQLRKTPHR